MTIELKVFEFPEDVGTTFESIQEYPVLYTPDGDWSDERYTLNAAEAGHSFNIYPNEIDRYIEILAWIKNHQASLNAPPEPEVDPDADVVTEEQG